MGFCSVLTDSRRPGPSLYIAVCGRRDAHTPRNVQKDPETSLAWTIKDELLRRGRDFLWQVERDSINFYYSEDWSHTSTPYSASLANRNDRFYPNQRRIFLLSYARSGNYRQGTFVRKAALTKERLFNKAMDELQKKFKLIPSDVVYVPKFTYIWSLAESRFRDEMDVAISREEALREIARAYLLAAGMTWRGELARVTGLSNPEAGIGNWALVDEGFAVRVAPGVYRLRELEV